MCFWPGTCIQELSGELVIKIWFVSRKAILNLPQGGKCCEPDSAVQRLNPVISASKTSPGINSSISNIHEHHFQYIVPSINLLAVRKTMAVARDPSSSNLAPTMILPLGWPKVTPLISARVLEVLG